MIVGLANEVVAGIAQAIATVIAVIVGYGLSVISDRKARQSVLDAQDKGRRLEAVVDIVDSAMHLREAAVTMKLSLSPVQSPSGSSATARASHDVTLSAARRAAQPLIAEAVQSSRVVARLSLTVRVLGADESLQRLAAETSLKCRALLEELNVAVADPTGPLNDLDESVAQLDKVIEVLLDSGGDAA